MVMSLRRKMALRRQAADAAAVRSTVSGLSRAGQVSRSTVPVEDADIPVVETLEQAVDTAEVLPGVVESADQAEADAYDAAVSVSEALVEVAQAAQDAANALTTASGKNSRRRGVTEPAPPDGGWVQGDQWVRDEDRDGVMVPVQVLVWDGTEFVPEQIIADDVLVIGGDGVIRLKNGVVSGTALAFDAIDGKTITGATVRTAESGQRLQLDASGLRSFNAAGSVTSTLYSGGTGLIVSGGSISVDSPSSPNVTWFGANGIGLDHFGPGNVLHQLGISWREDKGRFEIGTSSNDELEINSRLSHPGNTFALKSQLDAWTPIDGTHAWVTSEEREYVRAGGQWAVSYEDTGWSNVTVPGAAGYLRWKRLSGVIFVEYDIDFTTTITAGSLRANFVYLPAEARPGAAQAPAIAGWGTQPAMATVGVSGGMNVRNLHTASVARYTGSGSWPATA